MKKCVDIVVTYNRKKLLEENVNALLNQTYKNHDIMIIDNASTDDTYEMLQKYKDKIIYFNTGKNLGGAGGFAYGLKKAIESGYEYAWIMDDDSIPEKEALQSLIDKSKMINNKFSFMASLVYWTDGNLFPMNVPSLPQKKLYYIGLDLMRRYKIMPINSCSFVGCFVNLKNMHKVGLPISEFFIYGDDIEYTQRLRNYDVAYLDFDSIIIHKAPTNKGADIALSDESRIFRFYYQSRNGMYIARKNHELLNRYKKILARFKRILFESPDHKLKRIWVLIKGSIAGFFFNPKIEYVEYAVKKENN